MTSADMRRAFLGLLLLLAVPAAAQVTTSKPIEVEAPKPKKLQFKGEVLTVPRRPAVAGRFYPARPQELTRDLERYLERTTPPQQAIGCVVPHAGIMYSGHVAGAVYARLKPASSYIILCPNHTGAGRPLAIMSTGDWETPLGNVPIDSALAEALKRACPALEEDDEAHRFEHSLEVQLPFLQHLQEDFRFVPIAIGVGRYEPLAELGRALARGVGAAAWRPLLVASSDLNHYEPDAVNRVKDRQAIDRSEERRGGEEGRSR